MVFTTESLVFGFQAHHQHLLMQIIGKEKVHVTLNKSYGDVDKHHHSNKIIVQDEFKNGSANPVAMSGLFGPCPNG
jgi:hypothetical protein